MGKIRTAVVGCGKAGQIHAQALKSIQESQFVAVCDADMERAAEFALRYDVAPFNDLGEMLKYRNVQMVSVCTPHPTHPSVSTACSRTGAHVLVEKPMAVDLKGCDRMIAEAEKAGVTLGVVSQRRLYEPVRRVRQAIEKGKIGKPILCTLTVMGWRDEDYFRSDPWRGKWKTEGGGVLVNQTPHHLDLLQWFMGPIRDLFGYWENFNHPYIEVEDTAVAVLSFESGALGTILLSNSQRPGLYGKIHIHGESGASIGVQTDGESPFIAGVSESVGPPINDLWTVPGEEDMLEQWQTEDRARAKN